MSIYSARDSVLVSPIQLGAQSAPQELLRKKAEGRGQRAEGRSKRRLKRNM